MKDVRKRVINVFNALGCDTRLSIIELLSGRNYTTKELAEALRLAPSTISTHLRILKDLGIVWFKNHHKSSIYYLRRKDIFDIIEKTKEHLAREREFRE